MLCLASFDRLLKMIFCVFELLSLHSNLSIQLDLNSQLGDSNRRLESAQRCKAETLQEAKEKVQELEGELVRERERSTTLEEQLNAMKEKQEKVSH